MGKQIRVLMVTCEWPAPGMSKTAHFIKRQADFLRAAGIDIEVFVFYSGKNPFNYAKAWLRLQMKLRREQQQYDLIHAQFGQSGIIALPKRLPLVVTFRGSDVLGIVDDRDGGYTRLSGIQKRVSRIVARRADACIVVSEHMKAGLPPNTEARVIPSGIDFEFFKPVPQAEARQRLNLPANERLILFVGRPTQARKRYWLAKRAVEILNEKLDARLIVAWRVAHADIPLYMSAADALAFTSMQEGSPNVVKEALACNLPIVSVPVGDVPERLRGVENCELCADEKPETIAAALERVLVRKERTNGRGAVQNLDEKYITQSVIDVYQSVLMHTRVPAKTELMSRVSQAE